MRKIETWRTTPAGTHILAVAGNDIAHAWQAKSGRYAAHIWVEASPVYFDSMADALAYIKEKTNAQN